MAELPVIGAQLSVLDLDRHRDWLFDKNRDLELPEFCLADILNSPDPFIDMALQKLDGWRGRLGIHGPFSGFELDVKDRDIRQIVQKRLDQALEVCGRLNARQMVIHSPYDPWDHHNLGAIANGRKKMVEAVLETLAPALERAQDLGVVMVIENIKDLDPSERAMVVNAADTPALKLSVDTGHAYWAHRACGAPDIPDFITAAAGDLAHIHLQGSDGLADRHWPLDRGDTNWKAVFSALAKTGADPHLIIEINDFSQVQESANYLAKLGLGQ